MKNVLRAALLGGSALALASCSAVFGTKVPPGHVGIRVDQYGGGVEHRSYSAGAYNLPPGSYMDIYPVYTVNYTYTSNTSEGHPLNEEIIFQSKEGTSVYVDVSLSYHVDPDRAWVLYLKYRKNEVDDIISGPLHNDVRSALQLEGTKMTIDQIYGPGKAQLFQAVQNDLMKKYEPFGLIIESVSVAGIRIDRAIQQQINNRIANEQQAMAEQAAVATHQAQALQKEADAEGNAKSIQVESQALKDAGPSYVQLKAVEAWEKTGGKMPEYWGGGSSLPFIGNVQR